MDSSINVRMKIGDHGDLGKGMDSFSDWFSSMING